ncbi:MAG: trypsin-like peptidase domain-containing protein [Firmicutes bacterium]|nr:trypsin-like peptidase domain-containing protein [Bacillota bacterium]
MAQNEYDLKSWYSPDTPDSAFSNTQYGIPQDGFSQQPGGAAPSPQSYPPYRAPGSYSSPGYVSPYGGMPYQRQSGGSGKTVAIVLLAVALAIALIFVAFAASGGLKGLGGGQLDLFGERYSQGSGGSGSAGTGYPDNYRDYFSQTYGSGAVSGTFNIPRAATGTGVTLPLQSSAGQKELTLQQVYAKGIPSVVGITASTKDDPAGYAWGTGIIISSDGYIITNAHVIDGADAAKVTLNDGSEHDAKLVGADATDDIAVLKIDVTGLTPAQFGDLSDIAVGDGVVAIGNPLGQEYSGTMTDGIISAIDRNVDYDGHAMTLLQTNAALNEGNSGGPLLNMYGQVIGITNMKMMSSYTTIEGIGFAIPATSIQPVVDALIADGAVKGIPALGVTVVAVDSTAQELYGIPAGLYVNGVIQTSDAYKQGMQVGDIITEVNGKAVATTDDVNAAKEGLSVGDTLVFTVYRDGSYLRFTVALMDRSDLFG